MVNDMNYKMSYSFLDGSDTVDTSMQYATPFSGNQQPSFFGMRLAPPIPSSDPAENLNRWKETELFLRGTNTDEQIDEKSDIFKLDNLLLEFTNIKNYRAALMEEMQSYEKKVADLTIAEKTFLDSCEVLFRRELPYMAILTKEEVVTMHEKADELIALQKESYGKLMKSYTDTVFMLNVKLEALNKKMAVYTNFIKEGVTQLAGPDVKPNTCSVCMEGTVTHCLTPCGHTFCKGCIDRSQKLSKECMTCRTHTAGAIKLFFSI